MKMIMAVIKPFKLDDVRVALNALGVEGMTVTEVQGYGRQKGQMENLRSEDFTVNLLPKVKVEVVIDGKLEDKVVEAIKNAANTGRIGDGKIFVYDLSRAVRIRTGEEGKKAL